MADLKITLLPPSFLFLPFIHLLSQVMSERIELEIKQMQPLSNAFRNLVDMISEFPFKTDSVSKPNV